MKLPPWLRLVEPPLPAVYTIDGIEGRWVNLGTLGKLLRQNPAHLWATYRTLQVEREPVVREPVVIGYVHSEQPPHILYPDKPTLQIDWKAVWVRETWARAVIQQYFPKDNAASGNAT